MWSLHGSSFLINPRDPPHDTLSSITKHAQAVDWPSLITALHDRRGQATPAAPSFVVRCIRDGSHSFNSLDVCRRVGEAVLANQPEWRVELHSPQAELLVLICNAYVSISVVLQEAPVFRRNKFPNIPKEPFMQPLDGVSSLSQSSAYLVVKAASPKAGDVLLDCLCGIGTLMMEASSSFGTLSIGVRVSWILFAYDWYMISFISGRCGAGIGTCASKKYEVPHWVLSRVDEAVCYRGKLKVLVLDVFYGEMKFYRAYFGAQINFLFVLHVLI